MTTPGGPAGGVPTGSVTFVDANGLPVGIALLSATAPETATLTTTALSVGMHSIVAAYFGDANFGGAESAPISVSVRASTTTKLRVNGASVKLGKSVTLNAKVVGAKNAVPSGSVAFFNGSVPLGTSTLNSSGVAKLKVKLPLGTNVTSAQYLGDATNAPSTSAPVNVVVTAAPK
jgi:hypothetical protein